MQKEIEKEYRTILTNFRKYKVVMFTMARIMEMQQDNRFVVNTSCLQLAV